MAQLGRIWADGIWDLSVWDTSIWAQPTAVELLSAKVFGASLELRFVSRMTFGAGGNGGFVLTASGGALTASTPTGSGSLVLRYALSRTPGFDETITLAYTQPGDGVEDLAGNDLGSFSGFPVTLPRPGGGAVRRRRRR